MERTSRILEAEVTRVHTALLGYEEQLIFLHLQIAEALHLGEPYDDFMGRMKEYHEKLADLVKASAGCILLPKVVASYLEKVLSLSLDLEAVGFYFKFGDSTKTAKGVLEEGLSTIDALAPLRQKLKDELAIALINGRVRKRDVVSDRDALRRMEIPIFRPPKPTQEASRPTPAASPETSTTP